MLQFPAMPRPLTVEVTPQQLFFLDRHAERRIAADGTSIYLPTHETHQDCCTVH
jgi:hypothetical protein